MISYGDFGSKQKLALALLSLSLTLSLCLSCGLAARKSFVFVATCGLKFIIMIQRINIYDITCVVDSHNSVGHHLTLATKTTVLGNPHPLATSAHLYDRPPPDTHCTVCATYSL
jgi:hypothetical protein